MTTGQMRILVERANSGDEKALNALLNSLGISKKEDEAAEKEYKRLFLFPEEINEDKRRKEIEDNIKKWNRLLQDEQKFKKLIPPFDKKSFSEWIKSVQESLQTVKHNIDRTKQLVHNLRENSKPKGIEKYKKTKEKQALRKSAKAAETKNKNLRSMMKNFYESFEKRYPLSDYPAKTLFDTPQDSPEDIAKAQALEDSFFYQPSKEEIEKAYKEYTLDDINTQFPEYANNDFYNYKSFWTTSGNKNVVETKRKWSSKFITQQEIDDAIKAQNKPASNPNGGNQPTPTPSGGNPPTPTPSGGNPPTPTPSGISVSAPKFLSDEFLSSVGVSPEDAQAIRSQFENGLGAGIAYDAASGTVGGFANEAEASRYINAFNKSKKGDFQGLISQGAGKYFKDVSIPEWFDINSALAGFGNYKTGFPNDYKAIEILSNLVLNGSYKGNKNLLEVLKDESMTSRELQAARTVIRTYGENSERKALNDVLHKIKERVIRKNDETGVYVSEEEKMQIPELASAASIASAVDSEIKTGKSFGTASKRKAKDEENRAKRIALLEAENNLLAMSSDEYEKFATKGDKTEGEVAAWSELIKSGYSPSEDAGARAKRFGLQSKNAFEIASKYREAGDDFNANAFENAGLQFRNNEEQAKSEASANADKQKQLEKMATASAVWRGFQITLGVLRKIYQTVVKISENVLKAGQSSLKTENTATATGMTKQESSVVEGFSKVVNFDFGSDMANFALNSPVLKLTSKKDAFALLGSTDNEELIDAVVNLGVGRGNPSNVYNMILAAAINNIKKGRGLVGQDGQVQTEAQLLAVNKSMLSSAGINPQAIEVAWESYKRMIDNSPTLTQAWENSSYLDQMGLLFGFPLNSAERQLYNWNQEDALALKDKSEVASTLWTDAFSTNGWLKKIADFVEDIKIFLSAKFASPQTNQAFRDKALSKYGVLQRDIAMAQDTRMSFWDKLQLSGGTAFNAFDKDAQNKYKGMIENTRNLMSFGSNLRDAAETTGFKSLLEYRAVVSLLALQEFQKNLKKAIEDQDFTSLLLDKSVENVTQEAMFNAESRSAASDELKTIMPSNFRRQNFYKIPVEGLSANKNKKNNFREAAERQILDMWLQEYDANGINLEGLRGVDDMNQQEIFDSWFEKYATYSEDYLNPTVTISKEGFIGESKPTRNMTESMSVNYSPDDGITNRLTEEQRKQLELLFHKNLTSEFYKGLNSSASAGRPLYVEEGSYIRMSEDIKNIYNAILQLAPDLKKGTKVTFGDDNTIHIDYTTDGYTQTYDYQMRTSQTLGQ